MGIRIHKAVGWGLTPEQLKNNTTLEMDIDDVNEVFYETLINTKQLILPSHQSKDLFENGVGFCFEKNLLAQNISTEHSPQKFYNSAYDLYQGVYTFEKPEGIKLHLFFPAGIYKNSMYRYDDTIDYIESNLDHNGNDRSADGLEDKIFELRHNPYPWTNDLMDSDGNAVPWETYGRDINPELIQRPPFQLRWWLTETGILKPDAWKLLRPYYARWWC